MMSSISASLAKGSPKENKEIDPKVETKATGFEEIARVVGFIDEEYKCVHNNFTGTLYVGPLALYFLGRIFFFEWTLVIRWVDVVHVHKAEKGISIEVKAPKEAIYEFVLPHVSPDRAWASFVSLHNDAIVDSSRPRTESFVAATRRPTVRRMNSDPMQMSQRYMTFSPTTATNTVESHPEVHSEIKPRRGKLEKPTRSVSNPAETTPHPRSNSSGSSRMENGSDSGVDTKSDDKPSTSSMESRWSQVSQAKAGYSTVAIKEHKVGCNLDTFLSIFILDNAKHSIPNFMSETAGDADFQVQPWKALEDFDDEEDDRAKERTIEYTHPVNAPMAPPMARARKEQILQTYASHGFVLETKTFVADVPMTDCFYVADRLRVEPTQDNCVLLTMEFEIRFVKSTMFKSIITRTTQMEFEKLLKNFADYCTRSLEAPAAEGGDEAAAIARRRSSLHLVPPPAIAAPISSQSLILWIFLSLVVTLQVGILLELRSMRSDMGQIALLAGEFAKGLSTEQ